MTYTPQTWVDGSSGQTPVNATRLNYMENGILNASIGSQIGEGLHTLQTGTFAPVGPKVGSAFLSTSAQAGVEYTSAVIVRSQITVNQIGVYTTAASVGGSIFYVLGIRSDNGYGFPGNLLGNIGEQSTTAVGYTGSQLSSPITLPPGIYWFSCGFYQVTAPSTYPTLLSNPNILVVPPRATTAALLVANPGTYPLGYSQTGVASVLPATFAALSGSTTDVYTSSANSSTFPLIIIGS